MSVKYTRSMRMLSVPLVLILSGILLGLSIGEIAVRFLAIGQPEFYSYSRSRGWKLRAGASGWQRHEARAFVRISRWGYRHEDWEPFKAANTLRIAVLGDSFRSAASR
jgi:hypothetical protein